VAGLPACEDRPQVAAEDAPHDMYFWPIVPDMVTVGADSLSPWRVNRLARESGDPKLDACDGIRLTVTASRPSHGGLQQRTDLTQTLETANERGRAEAASRPRSATVSL
jgi:hypothetical protein